MLKFSATHFLRSYLLSVSAAWLIIFSFTVHANDPLQQASKAACEKFKSCAMQEMAGSPDITPQMKQMLEGMIAGVCDSLMNYSDISGQHELYKPATDCLNSMAQLSCDQLNEDITTPACAEYERRADQYSQ